MEEQTLAWHIAIRCPHLAKDFLQNGDRSRREDWATSSSPLDFTDDLEHYGKWLRRITSGRLEVGKDHGRWLGSFRAVDFQNRIEASSGGSVIFPLEGLFAHDILVVAVWDVVKNIPVGVELFPSLMHVKRCWMLD